MHPYVLDVEAAAAVIDVAPDTVRRWAHAKRIPGTRVGGTWRFWTPSLLAAVVGEAAADALPPLPQQHVEPGVVDSQQLSDLLGVPPRTLAALLRQGDIPAQKVGIRWRMYWPAIRDRLAAGAPLVPAAADRSAP